MLSIKQNKTWKLSNETKQRMSLAQLGKKVSDESKIKMSLAKIGIKLSDETREKMKISAGYEDTHKNWKGDKVSYSGVHKWVEKWKGKPQTCEMCGTSNATKYEWANVDHSYKRVLEDYIRMCVKCHRNYDKSRGVKIGRY